MTHDALYRAIVANPDDDTPRLVYADWLEENNRAEEAEFIRVQCRLEAAMPDHPNYAEWETREEELRLWLTAHAPGPKREFLAGLKVERASEWWQSCRRGFPRYLVYDGGQTSGRKPMRALAAALEEAFAQLPTRSLVILNVTIPQLTELLRQPVAQQIDSLSLLMDGDAARVVAESPLRNLRGLALVHPFNDAAAAALAAAPNLGCMEWLSISGDGLGPANVRAIGATAWFRNLRSLAFDNSLSPAAFEELCRLDPFPRLHMLALLRNSYPVSVWETFAQSKAFPALTRLDLSYGDLSGGRAAALFRAPWLRLAHLNLSGCAIGNDGAKALAAAPWVSSLQTLKLSSNLIGPSGVTAIARCRGFTNLKHLDLGNNTFGAAALAALAANPVLRGLIDLRLIVERDRTVTELHIRRFLTTLDTPNLRHLLLSGHPVDGKAARLLIDERFRSLTRLDLTGCKLTDTAVAELITAPALQNLIELDLSNNKLRDGLIPLGDPGNLPRLSQCYLSANTIDAALKRKLRRRGLLNY